MRRSRGESGLVSAHLSLLSPPRHTNKLLYGGVYTAHTGGAGRACAGQDPSEILGLGTIHMLYVCEKRRRLITRSSCMRRVPKCGDLPRPLTDLLLLFRAQDLHGSTRRLRLAR